jgi:hypothetical protein
MKKTLKIFLLIIFLFSTLFITTVNAAGILMNLQDYTQENQNSVDENSNIETQLNDDVLNDTELDENPDENEEENNYRSTSSTTVSNDDEFLTIENVLAIIIIVIGILLVLLSIAILIRLK